MCAFDQILVVAENGVVQLIFIYCFRSTPSPLYFPASSSAPGSLFAPPSTTCLVSPLPTKPVPRPLLHAGTFPAFHPFLYRPYVPRTPFSIPGALRINRLFFESDLVLKLAISLRKRTSASRNCLHYYQLFCFYIRKLGVAT
jgi:hypothetical protein